MAVAAEGLRVRDLMPDGFDERFPEATLTPKARRLLELELPAGASDNLRRTVADQVLKALPRFTTAARTIRRTRGEAGAREAVIAEEFAPGSEGSLARRREVFGRAPAIVRAGMQAATAAAEFVPIPGIQTTGAEVPEAEGFPERAGRLVGSVAGFTAAAAPATTALRGFGAGARLATALGAGIAAAVPQGTPKERAIRAAVTAPVAGASGFVGELAARRVAAPAAKMLTHAVTGGTAFGVAQPQIESRVLGHEPPSAEQALTAGLELTALNVLLGGRALIPGGSGARPAVGIRPVSAPEAPATDQPAGLARGPLTVPGPAAAAADAIPDGPPVPVLGGRTPREAFTALVQERSNAGEDMPAAVDWAKRSVAQALQLQQHVTPPPVPPHAEPVARTSPRLTQDLQRALGGLQGDFSVEVPGVGRVESAAFMQPLTRVFPWARDPVRVVVVDRETGQVYPASFGSVEQLSSAISRPSSPTVTPKARAEVAALEAEQWVHPEAKERRLGKLKERTGIGPEERGLSRQQDRERALAKLELQIRERPGDKKVTAWRRRAADIRAELIGRVPARAVQPEAARREQGAGPPAQPVREPAAPSEPAPTPGARREQMPTAPSRSAVPNFEFADEPTATRIAEGINQRTPGAEAKPVKSKRGWGIEVTETAAESKLKKQDFRRPPSAAPTPPPPERSTAVASTEARPTEVSREMAGGQESQGERPVSTRTRALAPAGQEHPPLRDVAVAEMLSQSENRAEFARMQKEGASDEQIESALIDAYGMGGGSTSGKLDVSWGEGLFRHRDEAGAVQTLTLPEMVRAVRDGMSIPSQREAQEARGQGDMFGGQTFLGGGERRQEAPAEARAVPTGTGGSREAAAPAGESKPVTVRSQSVHRSDVFQQRETGAAELVHPENIQTLLSKGGGYDAEALRQNPPLVWSDAKGELGPAGRTYVIDGHHRLELAQHSWDEQEGRWVKTGQADRDIPAIEIQGSLAYAKEQARLANLRGIPNSYTEQARIARELSTEGRTAKEIGERVGGVSPGKAQSLVNFAHVDEQVRRQFFPPGQEDALFGGTAQASIVGKWAQRSPKLVTGPVQREFLSQAFDEGWTPTQLDDRLKGWHDVLSAAKQEEITLPGGGTELRILMSPREFGEHVGRVQDEIRKELRQIAGLTKGMDAIVAAAKAKDDVAAARFAESEVRDAKAAVDELTALWKRVNARLLPALNAEAGGEVGALEKAKVEIAAEVTKAIGPATAPPPGGGLSSFGVGEIHRAIARAIEAVREYAKREPPAPPPPMNGPDTAPGRLMAALKNVTPLRGDVEVERTLEREKRIAESARAERGLSALGRHEARKRAHAGELPKVDFESVAGALKQSDAEEMMLAIYSHPGLWHFEQIRAGEALKDMLGEKGGKVPTPSEQALLEIVFGPEFVKAIVDARPQIEQARELGYEMANMPRALMTSWDMSAALRQGAFLAGSHPKEWGQAVVAAHRYFMDEGNFRAGVERMQRDPLFRYARRAELSITSSSKALENREELFIGAGLAEHVPLLGKGIPIGRGRTLGGVRASERGYIGLLNDLRFSVFKSMWRDAERLGLNPVSDPGVGRNIAKFINSATGRGESRLIEKHAGLLNSVFFSARFQRSRMHLLTPSTYVKMPWHADTPGEAMTREVALKSLLTYAGAATTIATLAAWGGAQIETDPQSPDFLKIRVGNVRYDLLAGFQQYVRAAIRFTAASKEQASHLIAGSRRPSPTPLAVGAHLVETKTSPPVAFGIGALRGTTMTGEKFELGRETAQLFLPMIAVDAARVAREDPRQLPATVPFSFYGGGVQAYPERRRKRYIPKALGAQP
jgi:hypothetical protein